MPLQIAHPVVVEQVERLARTTGLTKTALVERAVDRLAAELAVERGDRIDVLLAQFDRLPDRPDAVDPLAWDDAGLPR
jgi:antitoxin VapB